MAILTYSVVPIVTTVACTDTVVAAVTGEGAAKKAGKNSKKPKKNGSSGPGDEPAAHGDGTSHGSASEPDAAAPSRQQGEWHYGQPCRLPVRHRLQGMSQSARTTVQPARAAACHTYTLVLRRVCGHRGCLYWARTGAAAATDHKMQTYAEVVRSSDSSASLASSQQGACARMDDRAACLCVTMWRRELSGFVARQHG